MLPNCHIYPIALDDEIILKSFSASYNAKFLAFVEANRIHLTRYDPFEAQFHTIADVDKVLSKVDKLRDEGRSLSCTIWRKDRIIGFFNCGLNPQTKAIHIGYGLAETEQGKGIITRTARLLLDRSFRNFGMEYAWLNCWISNTASQRVAERLGFHRTSETVPPDPANGYLEEQYHYVLDKATWLAGLHPAYPPDPTSSQR